MENEAAARDEETTRIQQNCRHFSVDGRGQCEACGADLYSEELALKKALAWSKFMNSDLEER
jgi:hypothetical protein